MRPIIVLIGVLLIVAGAGLFEYEWQGLYSGSVSQDAPVVLTSSSGFVDQSATLGWTSPYLGVLSVYHCTSFNGSDADCVGRSTLASVSGNGGQISFTVIPSNTYEITYNGSASASIDLVGTNPNLNLSLIFVGAVLVVAGVLFSSRPRPEFEHPGPPPLEPEASEPPTPVADGTPDDEPTSASETLDEAPGAIP